MGEGCGGSSASALPPRPSKHQGAAHLGPTLSRCQTHARILLPRLLRFLPAGAQGPPDAGVQAMADHVDQLC